MRPAILAVTLLFAMYAPAEELYVPLGARTEVQLRNTSTRALSVDLAVLGGKTTRLALARGATARWTDADRTTPGVLRISGNGALHVTAVSHCDACGGRASLPVLSGAQTVESAAVSARTDAPWRSGILLVNPGDTAAVVTIGDTVHVLEPGGVLEGSTFRASVPLLAFPYDANASNGARIFTAIAPQAMTRKRRAVRSAPPAPQTQTVVLTPSKDNTLFESPTGDASNGAGPHLFAGATASRSKRRALVAFDVAAQVPPGSRITRATLAMTVSLTIAGTETMSVHRVTADWGEGTSNAGFSRDGRGATARQNDATWLHTFFPDRRWTTAGGDFATPPDATAPIGGSSATWSGTALTARVQQWLDQPATNFGWIVIGNEAVSTTAKRFDSREVQSTTSRPSLTIEFQR